MLLPCILLLADVIAMADVIANLWKMLNHIHLTFATSVMADVIAWWQMEWPLQGDLADVIAHGSIYFNFSSEVLSRTSSHI